MFQRGCNHQPGTIYTDFNSLDTHSQTRDESRCLTNLWVVPVFFTWASVLLPASPSASHFVVFFYYLRNIQQKLAYNKLKFHVPRLFVDTSIFLGEHGSDSCPMLSTSPVQKATRDPFGSGTRWAWDAWRACTNSRISCDTSESRTLDVDGRENTWDKWTHFLMRFWDLTHPCIELVKNNNYI